MEPRLRLNGPGVVTVSEFGPVDAPTAILTDGTHPEGVEWTASSADVADLQDGHVVAIGHGSSDIEGVWLEQRVSWKLVVVQSMPLEFSKTPAVIHVGQQVPLTVLADGQTQAPQAVTWFSSDPSRLMVVPGMVRGVAPGTAYITAKQGASQAVLQITIVGL